MKKIIALTLAMCLAAAFLTACGRETSDDAAPSITSPTENAPAVDAGSMSVESLNAQVGDLVKFGAYDWIVLDARQDKVLLLSNEITELRTYNDENENDTWETRNANVYTWDTSDLRAYLNGDFYNQFTEAERGLILGTDLETNSNPWYGTNGGANTTDNVFILSIDELLTYFGDSGEVDATDPNVYMFTTGEYDGYRKAYYKGEEEVYWTRTPGRYSSYASVCAGGRIGLEGVVVDSTYGVRPAMWVKAENSETVSSGDVADLIPFTSYACLPTLDSADSTVTYNVKDAVDGLYIASKSPEGIQEKWGIIDIRGNEVVPFVYDTIYAYENVICAVAGEKYGVIDTEGNEVIPFVYDSISVYDDDLIVVQTDDQYGIIDSDGNEILPSICYSIIPCEDGFAVARSEDGLWALLDKEGNEIIPFQSLPFILGTPSEGLIAAVKDGSYGFVDYSLNEVLPFIYENHSLDNARFIKGLSTVSIDRGYSVPDDYGNSIPVREYGVIDTFGNEIIPIEYGDRSGFRHMYSYPDGFMSREYWIAEKSRQMGVINTANEVIVPFEYDNLFWVEEGELLAYRNYRTEGDTYGLLDMDGNRVTPPIYNNIGGISENLIPVMLNGETGFVNTSGEEIIPCIYDAVSSFDNGMAVVVQDGSVGLIDKSGTEIAPTKYGQNISWTEYSLSENAGFYFNDGLAHLGDKLLIVTNDKILIAKENERVKPMLEISYQEEQSAQNAELIRAGIDDRAEDTQLRNEQERLKTQQEADAKFLSVKQDLVGKWLDADGNLAYTITEDMHVEVGNGWTGGSCSIENGELVMQYGMSTVNDPLPIWVISMPNSDSLVLTSGEQRQELTREPSAPQGGGLSANDIEKNIVGTWGVSTPQGEEKIRFMDDMAFESTSPQGLISTGSYYFEGGKLYVRMQTFLGTYEQEFTPSMDSIDSLWLSQDGDSINYTRKN